MCDIFVFEMVGIRSVDKLVAYIYVGSVGQDFKWWVQKSMISWWNILWRGHARVVYHRVWCGSVSYRNKVRTCCNYGIFGLVFHVRISRVVTECLSRHCIIEYLMVVGCELKIPSRGNCLASQGLSSDAEQLSRVTEFSIRTEQPLLILFLANSFFNDCN